MATTLYRYLSENISDDKIADAREWFRDKANRVEKIDTAKVIKENRSSAVSRIKLGHLYLFRYDAATKDKLPYFDRFPVTFIVGPAKDGFLGLNMHYLPYSYRARLMDALYEFVVGEEDLQRVKITYNILKRTSRLRYFKPCLKHYLNNQVESRFIHITPTEWDTAVFLPLQKFIGNTVRNVHRDSVRQIRR